MEGATMKQINIMLEDAEHERLKILKGDKTWKELLVKGCSDES